jgi:glycosyltransferase involved in cell wall biosynthesis
MSLLYVGTLYNRKLHHAIEGFSTFYNRHKNLIPLKFSIIGSGPGNEISTLKDTAERLGVSSVVRILGRVPHDKIKPYFDTHNIGLSYIPITKYYDFQPATKTYEYLLSGMPVLATATSANQQVIDEKNGVISGDTPKDISDALATVYDRLSSYDSSVIRKNAATYNWKSITNKLSSYLEGVDSKQHN